MAGSKCLRSAALHHSLTSSTAPSAHLIEFKWHRICGDATTSHILTLESDHGTRFFRPPDRGKEPTPDKDRQPLKLTGFARLYIALNGVGPELVRAYADPADLSSLRIRTAALLINFVFGVVFMTVGGMPVFAAAGAFNPAVPLIAILVALVKLRMECFLGLRGLYAAGKQALRKMGLKLPFSTDDLAWYFALAVKIGADIALALVVGHLFAQVCFRQELDSFLANSVAPQNAVVINVHRHEVQDMLAASLKIKQRDAADAEKLKGEEDALRKQQVLDTRRAATPTRYQRPEAETARQRTTTALNAYEAKAATSENRAVASAKAYDDLLKNSGAMLKALVEADQGYTEPPNGLLARLGALREIGRRDGHVFWGEALIEAIGVFCEMFLLVLSIARCPTHLSENLYYDYLKRSNARAVRLAGKLMAVNSPSLAPRDPDDPPPEAPSPMAATPSGTPPSQPPRRGRGRPPKVPLNGQTPAISNQSSTIRSGHD